MALGEIISISFVDTLKYDLETHFYYKRSVVQTDIQFSKNIADLEFSLSKGNLKMVQIFLHGGTNIQFIN